VTALAAAPSPVLAPFELAHVSVDGVEHRVPLSEAWAVPFETGRPVRRFAARKSQRHLSGLWWSATAGAHEGFESWLERDELMRLDFDPTVTGIASQPFWLYWTDEDGVRVHAPDYRARTQPHQHDPQAATTCATGSLPPEAITPARRPVLHQPLEDL
jgi:hypothetical protein